MPKPSAKRPVYLAAVLDELRLFSERAQMVDTRERTPGSQVQVTATTKTTLGTALVVTPEGTQKLAVNHAYRIDLVNVDGNEPLCEYESEYRAVFSVTEAVGVNPSKQLQINVVETYINQVAWVARMRAQGTLGQMAFGGVVLPKPVSYNHEPNDGTARVKGGEQTGGATKERVPVKRLRKA